MAALNIPVGVRYDAERKYDGYYVYAVFDERGRCAYVGCSRSVKRRLTVHKTGKGHVENLSLVMSKGHEIFLFTVDDVDKFFEMRNGAMPAPPELNASAKSIAEDAETYMCKILKPYLNRRKTYAPEIEFALDFFRRNILDRDTTIKYAGDALKRYGVLPDRYEEEMSRVETLLNSV